MTHGSGDEVVTNSCGGLHPVSSLSSCIINRRTTIESGFTTHSSSQLLLTRSSWNLKRKASADPQESRLDFRDDS
ncbi:hypothetical protein C4D60_Mb10t17760 [Musa balbisiana]|uniref:Uncharacterized protein n=1 Tax=Musa balbisiana TaxID=52838 RepID=A0A4S8IXY5_MUSBA|nr:hypothetical protein C4D60_Mb10t17760 [Musa balbisiana]